ncbi:MAG: aminopeptidase P family protein [Hyphomicrobiales bacterium]
MFQSFSQLPTDKATLKKRFSTFVDMLKENALDGYIIPHADAHQSEYMPKDQERLAYLTGFTGSAGWALVLKGNGALFVDGRYFEQAVNQTDQDSFPMVDVTSVAPSTWLADNLKAGMRIGYHSAYLTMAQRRQFNAACEKAGAEMTTLPEDLVDLAWMDDGKPARQLGEVWLHDDAIAGESAPAKLERIAGILENKGADSLLLTLTDSIAWTLNIRGNEVAHNPVTLAFALVRKDDKPILWIEGEKLSNSVRDHLSQFVDIQERAEFDKALETYAQSNPTILLDPSTCLDSVRIAIERGGANLLEGNDPVVAMKARKNSAELAGMRRAHLRDGAAMVKFLCWLDEQPGGSLTEIDAAKQLETIRAETAISDNSELMEISFDTISAAGGNAALPHYRVMEHHNATIEDNSLYLVDSGGQYRDGTTDITRTIVVGAVDDESKRRFTEVLRGHISVAMARFPNGTTGAQLDTLARMPLWNSGCDFAHGTGHGVGAYLCVHEGPASISKRGHVPLEPGMILSNEPGYYKPGAFGIRLENLVIVEDASDIEGGDAPAMGFETITFCPLDTRAIKIDLMSDRELEWLNVYHHDVFEKLAKTNLLSAEEIAWLSRATAPLMRC